MVQPGQSGSVLVLEGQHVGRVGVYDHDHGEQAGVTFYEPEVGSSVATVVDLISLARVDNDADITEAMIVALYEYGWRIFGPFDGIRRNYEGEGERCVYIHGDHIDGETFWSSHGETLMEAVQFMFESVVVYDSGSA